MLLVRKGQWVRGGIYLVKGVFQQHRSAVDGTVLFRRRLRSEKLLDFLASQPSSGVAMEACAIAHYWDREIGIGVGRSVGSATRRI